MSGVFVVAELGMLGSTGFTTEMVCRVGKQCSKNGDEGAGAERPRGRGRAVLPYMCE